MKNIQVSPFRSGGNGTKQVAAALLSPSPQENNRSDPPPHKISTNNPLFTFPKFGGHNPYLSKVSKTLFLSNYSKSMFSNTGLDPSQVHRRFVLVKESNSSQSTSSPQSSSESYYGIFVTDSGNEGFLIQPLRQAPRTDESYYLAWEGHLRLAKPENVTFIEMTSTPFGYKLQEGTVTNNSLKLDSNDLITLDDLSDVEEEEASFSNDPFPEKISSPSIPSERINNPFKTPLKDSTFVLTAPSSSNTTAASFTPNTCITEEDLYWKEEEDASYWPDLPPLVPTRLFEEDSPIPRKRRGSPNSAKKEAKRQKH